MLTGLVSLVLPITADGATIHVPADQPTIQAGVDSATDGDTVLVAPGLYQGLGNRYISFGGKGILLLGDGGPDSCSIYCAGYYSGFLFTNGEDSSSVVSGFRVTGDFIQHGMSPGAGGAVICTASSPTFMNCVFEGHHAAHYGGAVYVRDGSPRFINCRFWSNRASYYETGFGAAVCCDTGSAPSFEYCVFDRNDGEHGGAIACLNGDPILINCTMVDNEAGYGAHVYCLGSAPIIDACIIGFARWGVAVYCEDEGSNPQLSCCNLYGNALGDSDGCPENQPPEKGNTFSNPMFCDAGNGDYHLLSTSICLPENHECGILVGAFGAGCTPEFRVWNVQPDGSGDAVTIQDAIDSCTHGDTVLIHPGVYTGDGNRDLDLSGKLIDLIGVAGPENTIIDCGGEYHRGFWLHLAEDSSVMIKGLTVRNGSLRGGAGAMCWNASPLFADCWFIYNDATGSIDSPSFGGGVALVYSSARLENCVLANNICGGGNSINKSGGGVYLYKSTVTMDHCTIHGNIGSKGGAVYLGYSELTLSNSIVSDNYASYEASPIYCHRSNAQLFCADVFGNTGGDWVQCIGGQDGLNGNFSADPLFCDAESDDYRLDGRSPCTAANSGSGSFVGALDIGCPSAILSPDPAYAYQSNALTNLPGTTFVGNIPSGWTASDIDCNSVMINSAISPVSCSVLVSQPQFFGEVLAVVYPLRDLISSYTPVWDSTVQSFSVAGILFDGTPWEFTGEFVLIGRTSGDVNGDGAIDISDLVYMIDFMFRGGLAPAEESGDLDGNGLVDVSDLIILVEHFFG